MNPLNNKAYNLFSYLLILTTFFLLMEISFLIECFSGYFDDFNLVAHHLAIPWAILPGVLFFVLAQLLIHFAYALIICVLAIFTAAFFKLSTQATERLGLGLWFIGILTLLAANQYFFVNSRFASLTRFFLPEQFTIYLLVPLGFFWTALVLFIVLRSLLSLELKKLLGGSLIGLLALLYWSYQTHLRVTVDAATTERPNIIVIGVDSLRPDFLDYFGSPQKTHFFKPFLERSTVFSQAFTPLARTFPSWVGILSGNYPRESGVRSNLGILQPSKVATLLPSILRAHGYRTTYATDETRFSNIDHSFGFDELLVPPTGLNDFLLGSINDFPLSNLIVNTFIGSFLFPHSYGNRPVFVTYNPNSFLAQLQSFLKQDRQQPLFLAVHFCLPHHPYLWASYSGEKDKQVLSRYQAAIVRVDQQLNNFMAILEQEQLLKHALVVLLSDHGEAFELAGDRITTALSYVPARDAKTKDAPRFYPPSADKEGLNQTAGHGTDVLGFSQYHPLLAFRLYGLGPQTVKTLALPVLLLDIKPTILQFLKLPDQSSGRSLAKLIRGQSSLLERSQGIFLESDFSPEALRSVHPEVRNLIFEGMDFFRIDPVSTRIFVKESMAALILSSKQYALIDHDWVLALYPQKNGKMLPVLVRLSTGKWTTDLGTDFARRSPGKRMLYTLRKFFGKELQPT